MAAIWDEGTGWQAGDAASATAPVNGLPTGWSIAEDAVSAALAGLSVSDPDGDPAADLIVLTFAVDSGSLDIDTGITGGIVAADISGGAQGSGSITITATQDRINATLAANGLAFTPAADFNGTVTLTMTSLAGGEEDVDQAAIEVSAVNDAPVLAFVAEDAAQYGSETLVNDRDAGSVGWVSMDGLGDGGYLVAWIHSDSSRGIDPTVRARRFDAGGNPVGEEFQVNSGAHSMTSLAVAGAADGGFVVAWGAYEGAFVQRYDVFGTATGGQVQLDAGAHNSPTIVSVATLAGGGFVVTWAEPYEDGSGTAIMAQRFDAFSNAQGAATRVNSYAPGDQLDASIAALEDGGYVVVWNSLGQDGSGSGVFAQRFNAVGEAQGGEFRVNASTANNQWEPEVTALADGGFAVAWFSTHEHWAGPNNVYVQRFDSAGNPVGNETKINSASAP